jgi:hypothetical protein
MYDKLVARAAAITHGGNDNPRSRVVLLLATLFSRDA